MELGSYEVLRLIEHGSLCYVSSDCVTGKPLIQWIKYHPHMTKEQVFIWMQEIIRQLGQFHKLRGTPCYQYVNPYSIIVTEEKNLYLLDTGADSSQVLLKQMQRRGVRENFLPPEEPIYQKTSVSLDLYGLGKTLQYILAVTELEPVLRKKEERILKHIIHRCLNRQSKKSFQTMKEIQKYFPIYAYKPKEKKIIQKSKVKVLLAILLITSIVIAVGLYVRYQIPKSQNEVQKKVKTQKESLENNLNEANIIFDMGILYLLETKEYEKSQKYFASISDVHASAKDYQIIAEWLAGKTSRNQKKLETSLLHAEENLPRENRQSCYRILIRTYAFLDTKVAAESVIRLGRAFEEFGEKEETLTENTEKELMEFMAAAHEELGEVEKAAELYEKQLVLETEKEIREELYQKLTILWENEGKLDMAGEICQKGIEEFKSSVKLKVAHIRLLCKDSGVSREVCAQTIQAYIGEIPEIVQLEDFIKLQKEYDIKVEGEQVWVGQ